MDEPKSIWTRYWQFDRIASCFDGAGATNYDEAVAAGWSRFFGELPPDSRILDVCTGNGAAALMAAEVSRARGKGFRIVGIDRAEIDPAHYVTRHREALGAIEFRGGTAAEALPFGDASFDAVVSQYGIEYSQLEKSLGEAVRVLAPGGRLRFVLHAAEGECRRQSERVVDEADALLATGVVDAAIRAVEAVCHVERNPGSPPAAIEAADAAFAAFEKALLKTGDLIETATEKQMVQSSGACLLDTFQKRGYFPVPALIAKIEEVRAEVLAHRGRLAALVHASRSKSDLARIEAQLRALGIDNVESSQIEREGQLIAHAVAGERGA